LADPKATSTNLGIWQLIAAVDYVECAGALQGRFSGIAAISIYKWVMYMSIISTDASFTATFIFGQKKIIF